MNYLAHFHLAWDEPGLLIGGLLGDVVKGRLQGKYAPEWERGIALHRYIDSFTDSFIGLQSVKQLFATEYRRYAGIMMDVYFDYYLQNHWQQYSNIPHEAMTQTVYQLLEQSDLPRAARLKADNIVKHDMLTRCGDIDMMAQTLSFIGTRLKRDNPLDKAVDEVMLHELVLEEAFAAMYPLLQHSVERWRSGTVALDFIVAPQTT